MIFFLDCSDFKLSGEKIHPKIFLADFSMNFPTSEKWIRYTRDFRVSISLYLSRKVLGLESPPERATDAQPCS